MHSDSDQVVALVGAPNSGKTTLYNWLTNSRFKTVNYPGATVEYSVGSLASRYGDPFLVMDTPGAYSLFPKSADEEVTVKALFEHPKFGFASKVIVVIDGTQLARHLPLFAQIREAQFSCVVALTMSDLLNTSKIQVDIAQLERELGCPVIPINGHLGGGVTELVTAVRDLPVTKQARKLASWSDETKNEKSQWAVKLAETVSGRSAQEQLKKLYASTAKWDRWLLHPAYGLVLFVLIMSALFSSIFWAAAPFMDWIDGGFSYLQEQVLALAPENLWVDFLGNGVVASFGAVLVFVPQIFILFLGIGFLEGTGYLARAATLIDKPFSKIGLSGRSFVPLLSGFACAVPAMMATRNINSKRDRWITNFILPLMSCSARLPVYALLLAFLFNDQAPWKAGIALALIYLMAIVIGSLAASFLNKILARNEKSFFMMELPLYRRPQLRVLLKQTLTRTKAYVVRAGPMIFAFAVLIWVGTTFPNYQAEDQEKLQTSYLARAGQKIEPVFTPMGVDWRVGVGLMSAFAAREVFVSSLALMFNVAGEDEEQEQGLLQAMTEATDSYGRPIFTVASCLGLIVFFSIALQCMSTVGVAIRESGSWKFAILQLAIFNLVAYLLAVGLYQGLSALA